MVETNNFPFEVKVILGLETTFLVCRVVGWVAGLFGNITNSAPSWVGLGLGLSLAIHFRFTEKNGRLSEKLTTQPASSFSSYFVG